MDKLNVKPHFLKELISIIRLYCPKAQILAYGSRLGKDCHDGSDLDLVVKTFGNEKCSLSELKSILNDSSIPFLIDISCYDDLPDSFKKEIDKKNIQIYPYKADLLK